MINQNEKHKRLEELRLRAEQSIKLTESGQPQALNEHELRRLLYELQVHQVELEMQNEELQHSRLEIEKSRDEYADLYNFAPIQYFTLDREGHIVKHNLQAAQLLGYERKYLQHKLLVNFVAPEDIHTYHQFLTNIKQTATRQITQIDLINKSGERRIVQLQGLPSQHKGNLRHTFAEILLTATDITELKRAEAELRYAERFRHIIEGIPGMYLFLAPDYVIMEASNHYLQAFNLERKQVVGYTLSELFYQAKAHNPFTTALMQSLLRVTYQQMPHTTSVLPYEITLPDGRREERYWRITHSPVLNHHTQVEYIIHQAVDVTKEYLAHREIESSKQRFEMLAVASSDVVWEWNIITGFWWWNQNLEVMFGYNRATLETGMEAWTKRIHPEDKEQAIARLMETVVSGHAECRHEYRFQKADGTYAYILDRSYALQNENGKTLRLLGTMVDISEQKEVEVTLRKINDRFTLLLETIPQLAWLSEPDGTTFFYNRKWYEYTGTSENTLPSGEWEQYIHPEDAWQTIQAWKKSLATGQTATLQSRWRQASNGEYRWHIGQIIPVHDDKGNLIHWVGSLTDIHDQKLIEEALRDNAELRETQRKLQQERDFSRSLIDNSIDGIFTFDTTPCYTSWNPVLEAMYGISREMVIDKKIVEVFPGYQATQEGQAILQVLQGEHITLYNQPYKNREGFYEMNLLPLRSTTGQVIGGIGIIHDVSELIKLQEERTRLKLQRHKDLLNAILDAQEGERRRIAEALHNGLAQTLYATKLRLEQMPLTEASKEELQLLKLTASDLLAAAIKETRTISHQLIPTILEDFGLPGAIRDLSNKYSQATIAIKADLYGLEERIDKYLEIALYRIMQELVNNTVKHARASKLHIHLVKGELGILLRVSDDGQGFDANAETMMQAKKGIGLKTIQERVKLMNGTMEIQSSPGKGTTFTIKIPQV